MGCHQINLFLRRENYLTEVRALKTKLTRKVCDPKKLARCSDRLKKVEEHLLPDVDEAILQLEIRKAAWLDAASDLVAAESR